MFYSASAASEKARGYKREKQGSLSQVPSAVSSGPQPLSGLGMKNQGKSKLSASMLTLYFNHKISRSDQDCLLFTEY